MRHKVREHVAQGVGCITSTETKVRKPRPNIIARSHKTTVKPKVRVVKPHLRTTNKSFFQMDDENRANWEVNRSARLVVRLIRHKPILNRDGVIRGFAVQNVASAFTAEKCEGYQAVLERECAKHGLKWQKHHCVLEVKLK